MGRKALVELIKASGGAASAGQSFDANVTGSVSGTKMTDYNCTDIDDNVTTAIGPAWIPPRPPTYTAISSGTSYNVVLTFVGNARLNDILGGYGNNTVIKNPEESSAVGVTLAYVSRSNLAWTYSITFTGNSGTLTGNSAGAITTTCDPCNVSCDLYRVRMNMIPSTTTGAQTDRYFAFIGKPDNGEYNEWQYTPTGGWVKYGITVNGTTPTLEFAWTTNNANPDNGGNVVSTNQLFQTGLAETWNITRYGWVKISGAGNTWYGTGAMTYTDPCP